MRILGQGGVLLLVLVAASAAAQSSDRKPLDNWKPKLQGTVSMEALAGMPDSSAGCLLVGYHILMDGSVAKVRVMQGAYTSDVPPQARDVFSERAVAAVAGWAFSPKQRSAVAMFGWEVVGFASIDGRLAPVLGAESQDRRVRAQCEFADLASWGERNALPVDSPGIVRDGRTLVPSPGEPNGAFWLVKGEASPPRYPRQAVVEGAQGCVVVGAVIGNDGRPDQFRVMRSRLSLKGPAAKALEDAALYAVSQWRFSPGPDNPRRMPALLQFPVTYSLDGGSISSSCEAIEVRSPS